MTESQGMPLATMMGECRCPCGTKLRRPDQIFMHFGQYDIPLCRRHAKKLEAGKLAICSAKRGHGPIVFWLEDFY